MILLNIRGYFNALREFIANGIREGFVLPHNANLWTIVDDPRTADSPSAGEAFEWGIAALEAIERWKPVQQTYTYDWTARMPGQPEGGGACEAT